MDRNLNTAVAYDWTWRQLRGPMTFGRLYREALEICSFELYWRHFFALTIVGHMYGYGFSFEDLDKNARDQRVAAKKAARIVEQAFVRAYLFERRASVPPRAPITAAEYFLFTRRYQDEADALADAAAQRRDDARRAAEAAERELREKRCKLMFAASWAAIACLTEGA